MSSFIKLPVRVIIVFSDFIFPVQFIPAFSINFYFSKYPFS